MRAAAGLAIVTRLGGGLEDGLEPALLLLYLADVVLDLLCHVVERPAELAQLVAALYRDGCGVVAGGDPYGGVPGLGEGAGYLARQQEARSSGEQHAREDSAKDAVAQVGERPF
jgi:hypothetical protein